MVSESGGWGDFLDALGGAIVILAGGAAFVVIIWAFSGFPKFWQ